MPAKTRPDSPAKSWSSRSITVNSAPSAESRTREPSALLRDRIMQRRNESRPIYSAGRLPTTEQVRVAGSEVRQSRGLDSRLREYGSRGPRADLRDRGFIRQRSSVIYHDRPDLIGHGPRYSYIYRDRHDRVFSRLIWPGYSYPVYYGYGSSFCVRWVYPYYHRRYIWVSLGGWWPYDDCYLRYYWYGWHPYIWYGYYPIPREMEVSPDNYYYTYNYYYPDSGYAQPAPQANSNELPYGIDSDTYARMQAIIQKQKAGEPPVATESDNRFEAGVESFEAGHYPDAVAAFGDAMKLAPEDKVLPYAYAQALFAAGRYSEAAEVLRSALHQITPEQEGVFYPRGLYANDDVLFGQIEQLLNKSETYDLDGDLKLLLGYQLMGIGEVEYARRPLEQASQDMTNAEAAQSLLDLLDKMDKVTESQAPAAGTQTQSALGAGSAGSAMGQPQDQRSSAAKSSLLNKVKTMDSTAATPKVDANQKTDNAAEPNAATPIKSETEDPNTVSGSLDRGADYDGGAPFDSTGTAEAGLLPSLKAWTAITDERVMAVTGAFLLVAGALCLRRAGRLAPQHHWS